MRKNLLLITISLSSISLFSQDCADLFFSEYVEGPGNNNGLEIYNPTSSVIDLSEYTINRYGNGASSSPDTWTLTGTIDPFSTVTIGNGQIDSIWVSTYWSLPVDPVFFAACDLHGSGIYPTPFYFNGDDAMTLEKSGNIIDIIGKVGEDPGNAWTDDASAGFTDANNGTWWTKRQTLVRKPSVKKGVNQNPILFNPTMEWDSLPDATYSELGNHICDCQTTGFYENNHSYVIYPNPAYASSQVRINTESKISTIKVSNLIGLEMSNTNKNIIPTNHLAKGIYIIQIYFQEGQVVKERLIIQ